MTNDTVAVLGGRMAAEGERILRDGGLTVVSTEAYPSREAVAELLSATRPAAIVVRLIERLDGTLMDSAPGLRLIAKHGAGANEIDVAAAAERGVRTIVAAGSNAHSVAEHALMLMLALLKDLRRQDARLRSGVWDKSDYAGGDLRGRVLGLVGFGQISRALSGMARAFGMSVIVHDPFLPAGFGEAGISVVPDPDTLFARADIVSLHCPLTPGTRGLVDARRIGLMKPTAILVNTARGEIIDEPALVAALREGRIAGAGLDSFADEPPAPDHPFWSLQNVVVTAHIGGVSVEARRAVSTMTAGNVLAFLRGEPVEERLFLRP